MEEEFKSAVRIQILPPPLDPSDLLGHPLSGSLPGIYYAFLLLSFVFSGVGLFLSFFSFLL